MLFHIFDLKKKNIVYAGKSSTSNVLVNKKKFVFLYESIDWKHKTVFTVLMHSNGSFNRIVRLFDVL